MALRGISLLHTLGGDGVPTAPQGGGAHSTPRGVHGCVGDAVGTPPLGAITLIEAIALIEASNQWGIWVFGVLMQCSVALVG